LVGKIPIDRARNALTISFAGPFVVGTERSLQTSPQVIATERYIDPNPEAQVRIMDLVGRRKLK
jgi:hypothetical protein